MGVDLRGRSSSAA